MLNFRKTYLLAEFWPPVYFLGIIWLFLCLAGLFWVNPTISGLFCVNRSGFPFSRPAFPPLSGCLASLLTTPSSPPSSRTLPAPMLAVSTRWGWGAGEKKLLKTSGGLWVLSDGCWSGGIWTEQKSKYQHRDHLILDKPAWLIIRLLFGFASDCIWQVQPIYKWWDSNAV